MNFLQSLIALAIRVSVKVKKDSKCVHWGIRRAAAGARWFSQTQFVARIKAVMDGKFDGFSPIDGANVPH